MLAEVYVCVFFTMLLEVFLSFSVVDKHHIRACWWWCVCVCFYDVTVHFFCCMFCKRFLYGVNSGLGFDQTQATECVLVIATLR